MDLFCRSKEGGFLPQLLATGSKEQPFQYFLLLDHSAIPLGSDSAIAFKNLFASYFVFNCNYPIPLAPIYTFFEESVFRLKKFTTMNGDLTRELNSVTM